MLVRGLLLALAGVLSHICLVSAQGGLFGGLFSGLPSLLGLPGGGGGPLFGFPPDLLGFTGIGSIGQPDAGLTQDLYPGFPIPRGYKNFTCPSEPNNDILTCAVDPCAASMDSSPCMMDSRFRCRSNYCSAKFVYAGKVIDQPCQAYWFGPDGKYAEQCRGHDFFQEKGGFNDGLEGFYTRVNIRGTRNGNITCPKGDPRVLCLRDPCANSTTNRNPCFGQSQTVCIPFRCTSPVTLEARTFTYPCNPIFINSTTGLLIPMCNTAAGNFDCTKCDKVKRDPLCCGDVTYPNQCYVDCTRTDPNTCAPGTCRKVRAEACGCKKVLDPVCCNGLTYENKCIADCFHEDLNGCRKNACNKNKPPLPRNPPDNIIVPEKLGSYEPKVTDKEDKLTIVPAKLVDLADIQQQYPGLRSAAGMGLGPGALGLGAPGLDAQDMGTELEIGLGASEYTAQGNALNGPGSRTLGRRLLNETGYMMLPTDWAHVHAAVQFGVIALPRLPDLLQPTAQDSRQSTTSDGHTADPSMLATAQKMSVTSSHATVTHCRDQMLGKGTLEASETSELKSLAHGMVHTGPCYLGSRGAHADKVTGTLAAVGDIEDEAMLGNEGRQVLQFDNPDYKLVTPENLPAQAEDPFQPNRIPVDVSLESVSKSDSQTEDSSSATAASTGSVEAAQPQDTSETLDGAESSDVTPRAVSGRVVGSGGNEPDQGNPDGEASKSMSDEMSKVKTEMLVVKELKEYGPRLSEQQVGLAAKALQDNLQRLNQSGNVAGLAKEPGKFQSSPPPPRRCTCTLENKPLCCKGRTYVNPCFVLCAGLTPRDCFPKPCVQITDEGDDEICSCADIKAPVCCDSKEYNSQCFATCNNQTASSCTPGPCPNREHPASCGCTEEVRPICCRGKTYQNKCYAKCFYEDEELCASGPCENPQPYATTLDRPHTADPSPPPPPPIAPPIFDAVQFVTPLNRLLANSLPMGQSVGAEAPSISDLPSIVPALRPVGDRGNQAQMRSARAKNSRFWLPLFPAGPLPFGR